MNRDPRGFYAALRVTPDATAAEIQRAFRALMRLRHPDVGAASAGAPSSSVSAAGFDSGEEVRRTLEAFAALRDPKSRAQYDPVAPSAAPGPVGTGSAAAGGAFAGGREIPVRRHRAEQPVLRVTPVRWERGPW